MFKKTKLATLAATAVTLASTSAFAQEAAKAAETNKFDVQAAAAAAAGFAIAIAVLGGGLAQGRAVSAALEGISRNPGAAPRIQTPMILGLALIESLVLFAFAIAFLLFGKISVLQAQARGSPPLQQPVLRRGRPEGGRCASSSPATFTTTPRATSRPPSRSRRSLVASPTFAPT